MQTRLLTQLQKSEQERFSVRNAGLRYCYSDCLLSDNGRNLSSLFNAWPSYCYSDCRCPIIWILVFISRNSAQHLKGCNHVAVLVEYSKLRHSLLMIAMLKYSVLPFVHSVRANRNCPCPVLILSCIRERQRQAFHTTHLHSIACCSVEIMLCLRLSTLALSHCLLQRVVFPSTYSRVWLSKHSIPEIFQCWLHLRDYRKKSFFL